MNQLLGIEIRGKMVYVYVNGVTVWEGTLEAWSYAISHPVSVKLSA